MSHQAPKNLDHAAAHRHFSAECFNQAWTLIEKPDRTSDDNEAMILCALASLWHWTQRSDRTDQNLSISHWQISRVYALTGQGENAMRHAHRSLALAEKSPPFYVGYAHEAMARAAAVLGDRATFHSQLQKAAACAAAVMDDEDRAPLDRDLRDLANGRI